MKKSKQPEGDLSYLSGIGADSPQKEDIKSVIRPLEYRELTGEAGNEEGLVESINTSDGSSEIKKDEFVILERRIKSELPGFDFYIARRQKSDKVFEPETVLVAKRNKEHYVQKLSTEISKQYDILEEQNKLLTSDESNLMSNPGENRETSSGSYFVTQESEHGRGNVIGKGGFSIVRPALLRKKGKFTPEGVAIKETLLERREIEDYASEQEILSLMKKLKEINHGKWNYLANPIDTVEGDKHSGVWELLSSTGGKDFKVEDLRSKFEQGDKIPFEKKLIIIRQLFKALSITSKLGIFHNDVKPANILLTPKEIKLCDFGLVHFSKKMMDSELAKRADSLPENFYGVKPREGFVNGTVCYVHPRIVSPDFPGNKKDNGNPRYDVYSAALTAVQILTDDDGKPDKFCFGKAWNI